MDNEKFLGNLAQEAVALSALASLAPRTTYDLESKMSGKYRPKPLTKSQKKARAKSKRAKQARKKNRK